MTVHRRDRAPLMNYRCKGCRRIFNVYTGTALQGTQRGPVELVLIVRGISRCVSTSQLARELECNRPELLEFRRHLQESAFVALDHTPLPDAAVEADEMYQNAGEERRPATRRGRSAASVGQ